MKKQIVKILKYLAILALGVLLLFLAFRGLDFEEMKSIFKGSKYIWLIPSIIFSIFAFISRARRWTLLIEPLHHRPTLWNTYNAVLFGYLANYAFPRAGEITKCVALNRKEKIPVDSLIGTVIVERVIDMLSLLIVMIVLLFAKADEFGAFFGEYIFQPLGEKIETTFGEALTFWLLLGAAGTTVIIIAILFRKKIMKLKIAKKIIEILKGLGDGLATVVKMKRKWEFFFHTIFIWTNYAFMTWVVVFTLPGITDHLTFMDGVFLLVIGSMGMVVPVNAGIGAFHWIVSRGLHFVFGLELTEGVAFATIQHESQTLLILLLGSISMFFIFSKKKKHESAR